MPRGWTLRTHSVYPTSHTRPVDSSEEETYATKQEGTLKRKSAPTKKNRTAKAVTKKSTSAGKNRAEGIRLFALAGRPSKEDFVKVFGPSGPKMTWQQRAEAGVPAAKFQSTLAAAMRQAK